MRNQEKDEVLSERQNESQETAMSWKPEEESVGGRKGSGVADVEHQVR